MFVHYLRENTITMCYFWESPNIPVFCDTFSVNSKWVIGTVWQWFVAWHLCFIPRQTALFEMLLFCKVLEGPPEHITCCLLQIGPHFYQDKLIVCLIHVTQKRISKGRFKHGIILSYHNNLPVLWVLRSSACQVWIMEKTQGCYKMQEKQFSRPCVFHAEIRCMMAKERFSPSIDWLL